MRPDLFDARAAIDWAKQQIPVLKDRIEDWYSSPPYKVEIDTETQPGRKLYTLADIKPLDPILLAETGAIIHSIRSSLDLLAFALATRNAVANSRRVEFPVGDSKAKYFTKANQRKIAELKPAHRKIIDEELRPYPDEGGNQLLWALHHMDNTRKHRRLLKAAIMPRGIEFNPGIPHGAATFVVKSWDHFYDGTVLFHTADSVRDITVRVGLNVMIGDEGGSLRGKNLLATIDQFTKIAYDALARFSRSGT